MTNHDKAIAEAAVKLPEQIAGFECEDNETRLWHLIRSLIEWCDAERLDFDATLSDVRADFRLTSTKNR